VVSEAASADGLVAVTLLGVPLALYRQSSEHHAELAREFALIHRGSVDQTSVPARLQRLIDELEARFGAFSSQPNAALHRALAQGDERIDLTYRIPPVVKEAAQELDALLDEADAFCRDGQHLLTLATPPGPLAFRRWFLGEFVAQIGHAVPTPWDRYAAGPGPA